jgi:hypothetical protein
MAFHVLIAGGLGQVGAAVVRALAAEPSCAEVVMVNRRAIALTADSRVRQVILDTAAARFPAEVTRLAQSMVAQGDPVYGACCVGVGQGSMKWSEEELKALEIGVVGDFARVAGWSQVVDVSSGEMNRGGAVDPLRQSVFERSGQRFALRNASKQESRDLVLIQSEPNKL